MTGYQRKDGGFALPTILITCLALSIVLLSSMQTASSLRNAIDDQYYNRLALETAESGVAYAVSCLSQSAYSQTWISPLTQTKACDNSAISPTVASTSSIANVRTTFAVGDIQGNSDGAVLVTSTGTVNRLVDGSSTVAKTYTSTIKRIANSAYIKFSGVTPAYYYANPDGSGGGGMYYYLKGSDGKLRAVGSNNFGQLSNGDGSTANSLSPQIVKLPSGVTPVQMYANFLSQGWNIFVKMNDKSVYGAGLGAAGQLGNGRSDSVNTSFQKFNLPAGENARYVGSSGTATYVITESNNIYAAGDCRLGQLGTNQFDPVDNCKDINGPQSNPTRVALPTPDVSNPNTIPNDIITVDYATAYVQMKGGMLYGWGNNYEGELCNGNSNNSTKPVQIGNFGNPGQPRVKSIAFDGISLYVIDSNGDLWSCGNNYYGQLGYSTPDTNSRTFRKVPLPDSSGAADIAADEIFFTVRMNSGRVFGAGYNEAGQLGNGTTATKQMIPVEFKLPAGVTAKYIYQASVGFRDKTLDNVFVIGSDNKVYGAGGNSKGQLGIGTYSQYEQNPVAMQTIDGSVIKAKNVVYGLGTTIITATSGKVYTVGNNQYGQLGNGDTANQNKPTEAKFLQPGSGSFLF